MSTEENPAAVKQETAPVKTDPEPSSPLSPSKREQAFSVKEEENDDDDGDLDSEEDFLATIEKEEAQKESTADHHQSKDANNAPRLLQDALKKGDVKQDDSEEEEEKKDAKERNGDGDGDLKEKFAKEKEDAEEQEHVHQRVSQRQSLSLHMCLRSYLNSGLHMFTHV